MERLTDRLMEGWEDEDIHLKQPTNKPARKIGVHLDDYTDDGWKYGGMSVAIF